MSELFYTINSLPSDEELLVKQIYVLVSKIPECWVELNIPINVVNQGNIKAIAQGFVHPLLAYTIKISHG